MDPKSTQRHGEMKRTREGKEKALDADDSNLHHEKTATKASKPAPIRAAADGGRLRGLRVVRTDSDEAASDILLAQPHEPILFRGLGQSLGLVRLGLKAFIDIMSGRTAPPQRASMRQGARNTAGQKSYDGETFRAFVAEDRVERLSFADFVDRSLSGEYVYLETADTDLRYGRGHHVLDVFECLAQSPICSEGGGNSTMPGLLESRPLSSALREESFFKTRTYISILAADKFNMAEWHFDGFHQAILAVAVGGEPDGEEGGGASECDGGSRHDVYSPAFSEKLFEIAPPENARTSHKDSDASSPHRPVSGWAAAPEASKVQHAALRTGDVLYLPAGWLHRVTTRGATFTVNWGFFEGDR